MSRLARRLLLALLLAAALLPLLAAALVLQREPTVPRSTAEITPADVERALWIAQAHDPHRALPGIVRTLRLTEREVQLLAHHASTRWLDARTAIELGGGRARLRSSLALPAGALGVFGGWINIEAELEETPQLPRLAALRVGRLRLPASWAGWAVAAWARRYGIDDAGSARDVALTLQRVRFAPASLQIAYAWGHDAPARVLTALMPAAEQERVRRYAAQLADVGRAIDPARPVSLSQLLPPMFELARRRSAEGGDARLENRAALLVLGMVANGVNLGALLPERAAELRARPLRLTLGGRRDSTQHFLVSATLAAEHGTPLADLIGLYKELADARGGSGFSFNDMAANRAGTRFGSLAVRSPDKLQSRLADGVAEQDFMPDTADLPESLQAAEFRRRFGGPGSPAYQRLIGEIEERLDATALFR